MTAEIAQLRDALTREQAEKARMVAEGERRLVGALAEQRLELEDEKTRALAEAERRLVRALAEQRSEMEEEVRDRLGDVAGIRDELARERAEIQAELAAIRRQRSRTEPQLAAMVQPSVHAAHG